MFWQTWFNIDPSHIWRSLVFDIWPNIAASAILAVLVYFTVVKKMLVCKEKWCFRIGHHKVEGTHYKTCPKHSTSEIHKKWQHKHAAKYPKQHEFLKSKQ